MKHVGSVMNLFISQKDIPHRIEKENIQLDAKGIWGDKFYNRDINRSVLLTSKESYTLVSKYSINMPLGALGENLLIDFNPYNLASGTCLYIGKKVILEIVQNCTLCEHLSSIDKRLPELLKNDRGIFAKVIKEGEIKKGDKLYIK